MERPRIEKQLAEGRVEDVLDNLTERQKKFCEEYLIDFNGAAAVVRAGFKTKYPNKVAWQLLNHAGCKAGIQELNRIKVERCVVKPDYVINKIVKTIEKADEDNKPTVVLRGCELLARHLGMFIERTEISGPNGDAIKYKEVKDAADAFTSAIAGLIERGGTDSIPLVIEPRDEGGA